ncbi:MAG: outer membrane lipoprotein carrier protein LolA [Bacteroidales bacterium]|jgi:outer membrane lipoprotein-sorting protein|nr:outer membrane lipoprotein carrier protein LolA [Bacteroidales bacterium]MDD2264952.1 outer membrane lipoprotein carrier protein LolA [Bacteroidales bacterium]MDD2832120.1 outer membrane lipoprotein carrier protein LolA [Bacteroidales bacterium]MDD3208772.1 outer membrane lipoprotein carrier protein LolA [Bacteroidales bacterium]MDD3697335.1 outer membrane lipoprotein carrier protein LolA [Bacteroidales bacterium]
MKESLITVIVTLVLSFTAQGQTPEEQFYSHLAHMSSEIKTLKGSFTQTKEFGALDVKVVSKGTFRYARNNEMRFDYTVPRVMSIVVNGNTVQIISGEKTTTYSWKGQKNAMAGIARIMNHCMKGQLHDLRTGYDLDYQNTGKNHKVTVRHLKDDPEDVFESIELLFNGDRYALEEMVICERSGYVTTYVFSGLTVELVR